MLITSTGVGEADQGFLGVSFRMKEGTEELEEQRMIKIY